MNPYLRSHVDRVKLGRDALSPFLQNSGENGEGSPRETVDPRSANRKLAEELREQGEVMKKFPQAVRDYMRRQRKGALESIGLGEVAPYLDTVDDYNPSLWIVNGIVDGLFHTAGEARQAMGAFELADDDGDLDAASYLKGLTYGIANNAPIGSSLYKALNQQVADVSTFTNRQQSDGERWGHAGMAATEVGLALGGHWLAGPGKHVIANQFKRFGEYAPKLLPKRGITLPKGWEHRLRMKKRDAVAYARRLNPFTDVQRELVERTFRKSDARLDRIGIKELKRRKRSNPNYKGKASPNGSPKDNER